MIWSEHVTPSTLAIMSPSGGAIVVVVTRALSYVVTFVSTVSPHARWKGHSAPLNMSPLIKIFMQSRFGIPLSSYEVVGGGASDVVVVYNHTLIVPAVHTLSEVPLPHPRVVYVACGSAHVSHSIVFVPLAAVVMFPTTMGVPNP